MTYSHLAVAYLACPHARSTTGLPEFYDVSLPACHGLMTPPNLHILAL
jgi:hypothetical protein